MTEAPGVVRVDLRGLDASQLVESDDPGRAPGLTRLVAHLRGDGLAAYPTETVYGFGGRPSPPALDRLAALKRRDAAHPFLLLIARRDALPDLRWTDEARSLASVFWPGALTLILSDPHGRYPSGVRGSTGGVAVRETAHPLARALAAAVGGAITSTSANAPGDAPAADADQVERALSRLDPNELVYIADGGPLPPSLPSTLVDCTGARAFVVREGSIPLSRLRCVLPELPARV